jgi:MFS family permease
MVLPFLGKELGLSYTQIGFIITLRSLVSAIANIPGGAVVDLVGRRRTLMVLALIWVGLPYMLMGLGGGYLVILLYVALIGAGSNLWHPAAVAELSECYKDKRGWAIGIHTMAANIGDALGPMIAGLLLATLVWRQVIMINALPGITAAVVGWFLFARMQKEEISLPEKKSSKLINLSTYKKEVKEFVRNRNVLFLLLLSGIRSFTQNSLMTFLPFYFINILSMSSVVSGLYMAIVQTGGSIAAPLSGYLSDKRGRKSIISAGLLSTSLVLIILAIIRLDVLFVIFLSFLGFALFSLRPVILAWLMDVSPAGSRGTSVGAQFGIQYLFNSAAPLVGGWIADTWGLVTTFYFVAATMLLANVVVYFIRDEKKTKVEVNA